MNRQTGLRKFSGKLTFCGLLAVAFCLNGVDARAETLRESLEGLTKTHKRVLAAELDAAAAKENIRVARGDWYPTVDLTANKGYEDQKKGQGTDDTRIHPSEFDVTLTQQLWDFGSTNAAIDSAVLSYEQLNATLNSTRQGVLLEGIVAYLNLTSAMKILDFAKKSEDNLKKQTEYEDALVKRGSGLAMNKLQAKTQLAGAQARRVQAKGAVDLAVNRYRAVFSKPPENMDSLVNPRMPVELLPETVEDAVSMAERDNPQLEAQLISAEIAREAYKASFADEIMPTVNASFDGKWKNDVGGTVGGKRELLIKVEMTKSFNAGLTAINTLRAAEQTRMATVNRYSDARNLIEEQVRNTWSQLLTAKENAEFLENQANISAEFLVLARKDLQLGNTDLINVLAGETSLINASSDAEAAKTQVGIAVYTLLNVMGQLESDVIE